MKKLLLLLSFFVFSLNTIASERIDFNFAKEVTPMCLSPISNRGEEYDDLADVISKDLKIEIKDNSPIDQEKFLKFKSEYIVESGMSEDAATEFALRLVQKDKGTLLYEDTYKFIRTIEQAKKYGLGKLLSECKNQGEVYVYNHEEKGEIVSESLDWGQRFYNVANAECSDFSNKIFDSENCVGIYSLRESYHNGARSSWFEHEAIYIVHKYKSDFIITPLKRRSPVDAFDDEYVDNCLSEEINKDDANRDKDNLPPRSDEQRIDFVNNIHTKCKNDFVKMKSERPKIKTLLEEFLN